MSQKVALVTGAAAGAGAAICRHLACEGITVGVLDLNIDDATGVANEVLSEGGRAIPLQASNSDRVAVNEAFARLQDEFGLATILVNNAGITGWVPFEEVGYATSQTLGVYGGRVNS